MQMKITADNLDRFLASLQKRLAEELRYGVPIKISTIDHYSRQRVMEVEGKLYVTPAIGETVNILIGYN